MKLLIITALLITLQVQANPGSFDSEGRFIYPETNKPYTGNLEVLNKDWGDNTVEFSKDYVNGVLHGTESTYYQSGKLKSVGTFNQGKLDGVVTGYYEDGTVQVTGIFNNGIKQGRAIHYYPDGSKQLEQFYNNNESDGLHRSWFENGKLMQSIPYSKGLVHGMVEIFYEAGGVFERVKYEYGTPKHMTTYNENGSVAEQKGWLDKKLIERIVG